MITTGSVGETGVSGGIVTVQVAWFEQLTKAVWPPTVARM